MTSAKQREANRRNAQQSTGPTSAAGKAIVALNASGHGMLAIAPVVPGLEQAGDWEAYYGGMMDALAPVGQLELVLAERVALMAWRLQRVARYERETIALQQERVEEELTRRIERAFLGEGRLRRPPDLVRREVRNRQEELELFAGFAGLPETTELPEGTVETLEHVAMRVDVDLSGLRLSAATRDVVMDGATCTVGVARELLRAIATRVKRSPEDMLALVMSYLHDGVTSLEAELAAIERELDGMRRERLLPDAGELNKVQRYEAHLSRQLYQALHELQRLQEARAGRYVPAPVAVSVSGDGLPGMPGADSEG